MENVNAPHFTYHLIDKNNRVFSSFIVWSSVLVIKFLLMSLLTAFQRFRTHTAPSPEDLKTLGATEVTRNEDVERVRRAHRNDMENILPYLSVGLFYVLSDPSPMFSEILFRVATVARIVHSIVYAVYVVPQPARAICFFVQYAITLYMAVIAIIYFI